MEGRKRTFIAPLVLAGVLLISGLVLGFYIWGVDRRDQVDYKQTLRETIDYIATLEHRNESLRKQVGTLETELGVARGRQEESTEQRSDEIAQLRQRIEALKEENDRLKASLEALTQRMTTGGTSPSPQREAPQG
jgi:uncharacterized protein HemX